QTESPILNRRAAPKPVVGVAKHDGAGQTSSKNQFNLLGKKLSLPGFALAQRIHSQFGYQEKFGVGQHLQPPEITFQRMTLMQIDVKTDKIDPFRVQKFGGREV